MMEWLKDRLCNVIEIKSNEMIQSFLVERSWNQQFQSRKIFCTRRSKKTKTISKTSPQNSLRETERQRQCETAWRLVKAIRWLKSLTKFPHNIFREFQLDFYQAFYNFNQTSDLLKTICIYRQLMKCPWKIRIFNEKFITYMHIGANLLTASFTVCQRFTYLLR